MARDVLLIGIDAADYTTLKQLDADLPNISNIIDKGYKTNLKSSVPPWTPTAWTSLTSGTNPGKHGIFDFKTPDQTRLVNSSDVQTNRIWNHLSQVGRSSIVVNVPVTHPAPEFEGVLIPGYLSPEVGKAVAHPNGILKEVQEAIGEYRIYVTGKRTQGETICRKYLDLMQMRVDATTYLSKTYDWDFAMVQFQRTDTVFHELPNEDHINHIYTKLDECIGELMTKIDADTTLLVSDHGMGRLGEWDFRINSWLKREGYLETSRDGYQPGWDKPSDYKTENSTAIETATALAADFGLSVQRLDGLFKRFHLANAVQRLLPDPLLAKLIEAGGEKINREESAAFCPSGPGLGIYCDEGVKKAVIDELENVTDPDGNHVFEWAKPAEDVYDGPETTRGPDVLVMPTEMNYFTSATPSADVFEPSSYEFNHKVDGIFIATGEHVIGGEDKSVIDITDVAPTVLALLGVPLDTKFDGSVPSFFGDFPDITTREYNVTQVRYDNEVEGDVKSRLEDLGYMS